LTNFIEIYNDQNSLKTDDTNMLIILNNKELKVVTTLESMKVGTQCLDDDNKVNFNDISNDTIKVDFYNKPS